MKVGSLDQAGKLDSSMKCSRLSHWNSVMGLEDPTCLLKIKGSLAKRIWETVGKRDRLLQCKPSQTLKYANENNQSPRRTFQVYQIYWTMECFPPEKPISISVTNAGKCWQKEMHGEGKF